MSDTRELLRRGIGDYEPTDAYDQVVRRVQRKRRNQRVGAAAVAIAIAIAGSLLAAHALRSEPTPLDQHPTPNPVTAPQNGRPVFTRSVTLGGLTFTSPSDWFLVDLWGAYNQDDPSALATKALPLVEATNFDAGVDAPVCSPGVSNGSQLPADGVAIIVQVGQLDGDGSDLCPGGQVIDSQTGSAGIAPYRIVMAVGPDATETDVATGRSIFDAMSWTAPVNGFSRGHPNAYILDGWERGNVGWLLEARPTGDGGVSLAEYGSNGEGDAASGFAVPRPNAVEGSTFGAATQQADRVEYHRAGIPTPQLARLIDLPPSLGLNFDVYAFESPPPGGPSEVVAYGSDGKELGSNLPPLVHTESIRTVHAFGANWDVRLSLDAQGGYYGASCVMPVGSDPQVPCDRGWGGGMSMQSFSGSGNPAVFTSEFVGSNVRSIDLVTDDGRVFHALLLPIPGGGSVAVFALEGSGHGRLVHHLTDGSTDEGRRPEAHIDWNDIGQVVGAGSFAPVS